MSTTANGTAAVGSILAWSSATDQCGMTCKAVAARPLPLLPQYYRRLDSIDRVSLFRSLTASFGVQAAEVDAAAATWQALRAHQAPPLGATSASAAAAAAATAAGPGNVAAPGSEPLLKAAAALAAAATPRYARLFVPLSQQPGGIKFLVDMRADLLQVGGGGGGADWQTVWMAGVPIAHGWHHAGLVGCINGSVSGHLGLQSHWQPPLPLLPPPSRRFRSSRRALPRCVR